MTYKRIIPCLDIRDGRVVKGKNFTGIQDVDDPVVLAQYYNSAGADELVFYDITASLEDRALFIDLLAAVAREVSVPLTVGGNIGETDDFDRVISCGAAKVSVNSGAIRNPSLIEEAARRFGRERVVLSMDIKRVDGGYHLFAKGGQEDTGIDALVWAQDGVRRGAGELVVNSIDTDGVRDGFDLPMLTAVCERVSVPVVASGGAGSMAHFKALFEAVEGVDAGLAASIFHYKEVGIPQLKRYLRDEGVSVRLAGEAEHGPDV